MAQISLYSVIKLKMIIHKYYIMVKVRLGAHNIGDNTHFNCQNGHKSYNGVKRSNQILPHQFANVLPQAVKILYSFKILPCYGESSFISTKSSWCLFFSRLSVFLPFIGEFCVKEYDVCDAR